MHFSNNPFQKSAGTRKIESMVSIIILLSVILICASSVLENPINVGANTMAMFGMGILASGQAQIRCRWATRKAKVSRFAFGKYSTSC